MTAAEGRILRYSVLAAAGLFLFSALSLKPPHFDEGINGYFVNQIWTNGFFTYDPGNYHGPLLFYLFQISEKIFGFGVGSFRFVTALFSFLTVWLAMRSSTVLGRYGSHAAALAMALSPGVIFFGRSAIHEPIYVFFQVLWMLGFIELREKAERRAVIRFLAGLTGCLLLKETFVILCVAFLAAWAWVELSPAILKQTKGKGDAGRPHREKSEGLGAPFLLKAGSVAFLAWLALYTGFFHNWKGASDFFVAIMPWLKTGIGASGHDKPFYYWLQLLGRYEWPALAGLAGACAGVFGRSWKMRFFSVLALVNFLIYSFIPYKTPWCIISLIWPFFFVAGLWTEDLVDRSGGKRDVLYRVAAGIVVIILARSAVVSYRLNFIRYTDPAEPYVYVQTKNDIRDVQDIIRQKIKVSPEYHNMKILIKLKDSWPLPWLFSRFPNVEYGDYKTPGGQDADIIFGETDVNEEGLGRLYVRRRIELRDAREPIYVYLKESTFEGLELPGFGPVNAPEGKVL
ncbi:MAG: TIGR03663 family protein [Candidatus Sulfobium sp.]